MFLDRYLVENPGMPPAYLEYSPIYESGKEPYVANCYGRLFSGHDYLTAGSGIDSLSVSRGREIDD